MNKKTENVLYVKASSCFDSLKLAIQTFEEFLKEEVPATDPKYYKARNYLRYAEQFYQETFKEAKRLLGPMPLYASADFEKWRQDFLSQHNVLVASQNIEDIKKELTSNEPTSQWLSKEDVERLLLKNYDAQKTGKRKLTNIKVRIILDKLFELPSQAQDPKKKSMEEFQAG
jgi:hypothetical protein